MILLFLKRVQHPGACHYVLSETYCDNGLLRSRELVDLGSDPSEYIVYPGGSGFYFQPALEERLRGAGAAFESSDLEHVFKPFLKPEILRLIELFDRGGRPGKRVACNLEDLVPDQRSVHIFDARRLYYLRFGRTDSGELAGKHWKFLDIFLCKSRDEIESVLERMERELPPREYAAYVYASLGIPLFFPRLLRDYPTALDREKLDNHVIEELCRLDSDENFFLGVEKESRGGLHPYLMKYAWLYFDYEFQVESWVEGFDPGREFRQAPPPPRRTISAESACALLGISSEQFAKMSRKELTRLFRSKAKRSHPDKGGEHEDFLRLSEAYEQLLNIKKRDGKGRG